MEVLTELLLLLLLSRIFGVAAERLGQPASAGEILAGVFISIVALQFGQQLPFLNNLVHSEVLAYTADVGIFCLVLLAGIDTEYREIAKHSAESFAVALGGVVVPLLSGFALAWLFLSGSEHRLALSFLTGIVMSITAVPATAKVLQELQLVHTRMGQVIIGAALFDDVIGMFLLAVLLGIIGSGDVPGIAAFGILLVKVSLFFAITITLGVKVYPHVSRKLNTMQATSLEFSAMAIVALAYGLLAESLGMHWILGAFMAGLFFERARVGSRSYLEIKLILTALTRGMLAPLFFVSIGVRFDPQALTAVPVFLTLLVSLAFAGKIIGCGVPARMFGLQRNEAIGVGIGMSMRGAVEFVVLSIAYNAGMFLTTDNNHLVASHLFSGLVLIGVVTTLIVPPLLRRLPIRN